VLSTFRQEAAERLARIDEHLLLLEQGTAGDEAEAFRLLFREAHSLKGAAGLLDLGPIVAVMHSLETVMERLRNGSLPLSPSIVEVLLQSTDTLRNLLNLLDSPNQDQASDLINALDRLARNDPSAMERIERPIFAPQEVSPPTALRLAICDDAMFSRKLIADIAREAGWAIAWEAKDGREAVELYRKDRPNLLTLDLTMPVMPGIDALREIRTLDPSALIVIVSAIDQRSVIADCLREGASDFMTKPVDRNRIQSLLQRTRRNRGT
jgi:two-component system chemotaxis response regulator CheY